MFAASSAADAGSTLMIVLMPVEPVKIMIIKSQIMIASLPSLHAFQ